MSFYGILSDMPRFREDNCRAASLFFDKPLKEANNLITSLYIFSMATDSILEWTSGHPVLLYSKITLRKILYNCTNMTFLWNENLFFKPELNSLCQQLLFNGCQILELSKLDFKSCSKLAWWIGTCICIYLVTTCQLLILIIMIVLSNFPNSSYLSYSLHCTNIMSQMMKEIYIFATRYICF